MYTFEIDADHTTATLVSFYSAPGGAFVEYLELSDDDKQMCVVTPTSYHFLRFDIEGKKWVASLNIQNTIVSMIKTQEDKVYAILEDSSIVCHDLSGAVILDFNFEKNFYEYNNSDINSYISIWAKNSENQYVATNIKLTIAGNCVWQTNGSQTLETQTSAEGPIAIPFTIKGQTAINVSVDAII